jgi:RNase H-fold protein (predicted Holliday junction resolvase)
MIKSSSAVKVPLYLGFDPGQDKCGLAIVDAQRSVYWHEIVLTDQVRQKVQDLCQTYPIQTVILGDQTRSRYWQQELQNILPPEIPIQPVDERYSSLEARSRYWDFYPPQGWRKLLPLGLRQPPRPVDDIVAIVLVERFLQNRS